MENMKNICSHCKSRFTDFGDGHVMLTCLGCNRKYCYREDDDYHCDKFLFERYYDILDDNYYKHDGTYLCADGFYKSCIYCVDTINDTILLEYLLKEIKLNKCDLKQKYINWLFCLLNNDNANN